jgi:hypothetical protein
VYFNIVSQNEEERSATLAGLLSDGYRMSSGAGAVDRINHFYPFASYPDITITWGKDTPIKIIYLCDEGGYRVTFSEFLKLGKLSVISNMGGNKKRVKRNENNIIVILSMPLVEILL